MTDFGIFGSLGVPLALGLLRLSTEGRPAQADAIGVIHAALDAGIRVLDTADSYALDDRDLHYGERLAQIDTGPLVAAQQHVDRTIERLGPERPRGL